MSAPLILRDPRAFAAPLTEADHEHAHRGNEQEDGMNLKKYRYDNEYHDGLEEDPTGAWYFAADVEAREREIIEVLRICTDGFGRPDGPSINNRKRVYSLLAQMEWRP
jgi:hypothetical protein